MPKSITKRTVVLSDHETSVSLEPEFWEALREIAAVEGMPLAALIRRIDGNLVQSKRHNISSAIRVFILKYLQEQIKKRP